MHEKDQNEKIVRCEQGIANSVFLKLQGEIEKYFKNYALQQFGTSVLEGPREDRGSSG